MSDKLKQDAKAFGHDFRARRKAAGLTQAEVGMVMTGRAGNVGVSGCFIGAIERGLYTTPKAFTKRRLNNALERAIYNKRHNEGPLESYTPPAVSRKLEAIETFLLFLASVAVGALAVLAYNVMNGG